MKFGVIGAAGKIGGMRVATILAEPRASLAAVMDMTEEQARSAAHGAPAFADLDKFFEVEMDAVVISTPAHVREPLCLAAFERGLHVLSEKPLAHTLEASRRIVAAARAAQRRLGGGFNMRYYPAFAYVRDVMDAGAIGDIDHVRVYGGHAGFSNFTHDWEYKSHLSGGGALWDVGIHMTDMAGHLLGEITSVYGVATERVWREPGSEDNAMAIFKSPSGVSAIYQATWSDWKGYKSAVEVYGTHGMVRGAYAPMENLLITLEKPGGRRTSTVRRRYLDVAVREKLKSWKTTAQESFQKELGEFIDLIEGERDLRIADGRAALRAVEVAAAVAESSRTGREVHLENLGDMADLRPQSQTAGASAAPSVITRPHEDDVSPDTPADPKLSVIVICVDGGPYLRDFLLACARMTDTPPLEIIVPYDASIADVLAYRDEFPDVNFLDLGVIVPERPITSEAGQHELYDRRRAAGLGAATGDIVAMLEDRGHPRPDWARAVVRLHQGTGNAVIGGAIECRQPAGLLNWAFYVTDFGRYGRPFKSGPVGWVSDVNVSYSRRALEETRRLWKDRFQEPVVHWYFIEKGEKLLLSDELVVDHVRPPATLGRLIPERFQWGRLFGHIRGVHARPLKRLGYVLASPFILPVLWVRHGITQASKGRTLRYIRALPYIVVLTFAWMCGETWGTITRKP